jgi:hypothetical protein
MGRKKKKWWQDSFVSEEEALAVMEVLEPLIKKTKRRKTHDTGDRGIGIVNATGRRIVGDSKAVNRSHEAFRKRRRK